MGPLSARQRKKAKKALSRIHRWRSFPAGERGYRDVMTLAKFLRLELGLGGSKPWWRVKTKRVSQWFAQQPQGRT